LAGFPGSSRPICGFDHADAVALYAARLLHSESAGWRMTGIDPEGIDLRNEAAIARLDFSAWSLGPVLDPSAARRTLVALVDEARATAAT
jgi:heme iron utilization protein